MRLILYLVVFKREAKDWLYQDIKIGYDRTDNNLNIGFKPEWHHFFPKSVLKNSGVDESKINLLANIVVLNEKANRTFKSKEPMEYLKKYNVDNMRLIEQLVPTDDQFWQVYQYDEFLNKRAKDLTEIANNFMGELKNG